MKKKLRLLEMAKGFKVEEFSDGWEVSSEDTPLMAFISNDDRSIKYFRVDIDNEIGECAEIDVATFLKLKAFCEELIKC